MDASGPSDLHRMALIKGKRGAWRAIVGRHMDVSGALDLHQTIATHVDASGRSNRKSNARDAIVRSCDCGAIHGLTLTRRTKSDNGMRLDREIMVHDHHAIIVHDHCLIMARNRPSPDQTALIFRGNSSLKTNVLLFFS